jgi:peptidyl-prolyl cis-trans isomerase D
MLRGIRTASANWLGRLVMGVVLGLIAVSFAIWGIGDIFRGFGRSSLAQIGHTEISIEEFRRLYNDRLQELGRQLGRPISLDQARALGVDQQLVGQLIGEASLDERVKSLRLGVSDAEIARRITEMLDLQGPGGQFDRARFDAMLRNRSTTERRYIADLRRLLLRRQLAGTVLMGTTLPKAAIEAAERYRNEQRTVEYVLWDRAHVGDIPAPTDDELAKYFEERKALFRAPEYRKIVVLPLLPGEQAMWLEVSEDDVKKAYEERRSRYLTPERRTLQRIQFNDPQEAQAAADRIASGTSFDEIAKERKLTEKDLDLGTLTKSAIIDPAIAEAAFALKDNSVSGPVKGRFGTVIIRVLKIEPESVRPFAEVREELTRDLRTERARSEILPIYDKIEDERSIGRTLTETAANLKLAVKSVEITRDGRDRSGAQVTGVPEWQRVLTAAFATDTGVDNDPIQVAGGYIWYEVTEISPAHEQKLDEVKEQVESRWRDDQAANRLRAKASEMLEKLKAGGSFSELAAAAGLKIEKRAEIKRGNALPPLATRTIEAIFRAAKDGYGTADADAVAEQVVFHVVDVTMPAIDEAADEVRKMRETMTRSYSEDVFGAYLAYVQRQVGVTVNQNALKQVVTGQSSAND